MAVEDVLAECDAVRADGNIPLDELSHAQASLTRGYVRHFETTGQLVRAAAQLVTHDLDADTFDRFVPGVDSVTAMELAETARRFLHPGRATVVVVGDASVCRAPLEALGRPVIVTTPEF